MIRSLSLTLALTACAPATVDLVQPDALSKATLGGEWYWLDSVVDVPYGTASTFVGARGSLERIRWRIDEDRLVGVRSYDHVADPLASLDDDPGGAPLVAFRIVKQFDIRRAYDPRTGEESNVIEENTERPWYEREHLRVDWSQNLLEGETGGLFAGAPLELTPVGVGSDAEDAWAPELDDTDADGTIDHMRLYRRVIVSPDTRVIPGYGEVPTCWFYGKATSDCAPSEVVVGSSFRRVDEDDLTAGLAYDARWMATFGFFTTERMHYDRRYGVTETERVRWANRHALWTDEVLTDDDGAPLCTRGNGKGGRVPCVELSVADAPVIATRPADKRTVRPVVYHVGPHFDPTLAGTLPRIEAEWNAAFRDVVNEARRWACLDREGGTAEACARVVDPELQAFVLCPHNPSQAGDPAVCTTDHTGPDHVPDGTPDVVLPGDLRYSLLHVVDTPQLDSPFGYGPSAADPVGARVALADGALELGAGRILAADAIVYAHALDRIATSTTDLVRLIDGGLSEDAYVEGENVRVWVEELRSKGTTAALPGHTVDRPPVGEVASPSAAADALAGMRNSVGRDVAARLRGQSVPTHPSQVRAWWDGVDHVLRDVAHVPVGPAATSLGWVRLRASPFDEALWDDETIGAYGFDPSKVPATDALLSAASPLDLLAPDRVGERVEAWQLAGEQALDLDDGAYTNPSLLGLARRLRGQGLDDEGIRRVIREELFVSVALHEIGHTVGLRHNFAGSVDAWNYDDTYWALRDDGDMGPRHVDPLTDAEVDGGLLEHAYSSVMDYHMNRNGDWHGLGRYDRAAVKFGYAQLVEVMTDVKSGEVLDGFSNRDAVGVVSYFDQTTVYPVPILGAPDGGFATLHYTDFPRIAALSARVDVPYARLTAQLPPARGAPGFDGFLVVGQGVPGVVSAGLPAAPYRFCSDELASGAMCARFDEGADPFEIVSAYQRDYWDRYVIDNFARDRYGFGFSDPVPALLDRTFGPLHTWSRYYTLFHTVLDADGDEGARAYLADPRGLGGWTVATRDTFDFLARVIARPEPGDHVAATRPDGVEVLALGSGPNDVAVPLGAGAWYDSDWDDDAGYWWFERRSRVGTYWDRMVALQLLTTNSPYDFVGFDTASDPRAYALGYDTLWRDPLARLLGALVADDVAEYAPRVDDDGGLVYPDPTGAVPLPEGRIVDPGAYWLVRYAAGLLASGMLREGYDETWLLRARIAEVGSARDWAPGPDVEVVTFSDPRSGVSWHAWRFPGDHGEELGAGARLLDKAALLDGRCDDGDVTACDALVDTVNDVRMQARIVAWFDGNTAE